MSNAAGAIAGNLTRDAELTFTSSGSARLTFGVAVDKSYRDKGGEWQTETSFFDVVAWRGVAESNAGYLVKGLPVIVMGDWEQRSWETAEGDRRSKVEFRATQIGPNGFCIESIQRKARGDHDGGGRSSQPSAPPAKAAPDNYEPF